MSQVDQWHDLSSALHRRPLFSWLICSCKLSTSWREGHTFFEIGLTSLGKRHILEMPTGHSPPFFMMFLRSMEPPFSARLLSMAMLFGSPFAVRVMTNTIKEHTMSQSSLLSRRQFLCASAGLSASALLAACVAPAPTAQQSGGEIAAPEAAKTQVLLWDQFAEATASTAMDQMVAQFNEQNADIEVVREVQATGAMRDVLRTALDAGAGPDVVYYDTGPGFAGVLARAGMLAPLDQAYSDYGWDERLLGIARERTTFDGVTYGIGNELEFVGMFYNQRIFEENSLTAPTTHDELVELTETLKNAGITPVGFGNQDKWPAGHTFSVFSGNIAGKEKLAQAISGEVPWNDEDFVQAIQIPFVEWVEAGIYNTDVNAVNYDDSHLLFYSGQVAMRLTGSWMILNYTNPDNMPDPVGFFFYPPIRSDVPIAPPAGLGSGYFVSKAVQAPEAAFEFLDYLFSEETAASWLESMARIPPLRLNPEDYNISDLLAFTLSALDESGDQMGYNVDVLTPDTFNTMMFDGFQEVIGGTKSAQQQADDLEATMQQAKADGKTMDITD
jgi:raffinose/stachyose/melibiose transport system substrate-binding protein